MYCELDHLERRAFLHDIQLVIINTFEVFLDVAKFRPFLLDFVEILGAKRFLVFESGPNLILPDKLGILHLTNHIFIHCFCLFPV